MIKVLSKNIFVILSIVFFINACKTVKPKVVTNSISIEKVYNDVMLSEIEFKSLNIKFNVTYEKKDQSMSLKGNIKILKDSIIWVTLSPGLGIEAARLMCTNDSVYFLDKLHGSLTKGKYSYIKNLYKIDVDFHSLQSILTNSFFVYPSSVDQKSDFISSFKITKDSSEIAVYRKSADLIENLIYIEKTGNKISSYIINDVPNKKSLNVKYRNTENAELKNFPAFINIKSLNEDKFLVMDIEYTKVTVNEELTFSFKVPASYKIIIQ